MLLLLTFNPHATGQSKPVTVITSLAPPFTPFLGEYANDITDKLRVTLVLRDSRVASYPVKLVMSLELVGYGEVMRTASYATTPVFYIDNGSVTLGGADLASFFVPANIEFTGNTGQMYLNTGRIPDGLYRIGFSVVDAMRQDVVLASTGYSAPSWFVLNQPPLPTLPGNDEEVTLTGIQNVRFSWTPRHLGSGNTAFATEYHFQLYEMRVANVGKDQTVLSTAPVYTTTTTSTSLFLTDGDYPLEQGVSYVWRVTADDGIDGFTLFENEGRSETRSFTYGCLCPVPHSPLPYTVTSDKATIEWTPDPLHMEYETRFRLKGDNDGLWHTRESYLGETVIDKVLSPLTSYEYQVRARCFNGEWSDYSPVNWFTTTDIAGSGIECGKSDVMAEITNRVPKPMLYAGEVITYGDWRLVLTEVTGGNGIFSGKCTVAVPLFNYARVNMFFDNIRVNELNQVTSGAARSVSSDDSRMMVEDITDYFNEGDQTGNIIDNVAVAELTLGFEAGDGIRGTVSSDGTTITVISGDNSQTFTVENLDNGTTAVDTQGNIYAVSGDGTATLIGKDMAASRGEEDHSAISKAITGTGKGTQAGETAAPTGPSPFSAKISFTATGRWAIDERDGSYAGSPLDGEYSMFDGAYVPWKLVPEGKSDKLRVTVSGQDPDPGQIRFITATGTEFFAKRNGSDYDLEILGGGERDGYELYVVYEYEAGSTGDDTDAEEEAAGPETESDTEYQVLGKLNVASYPLIERSVVVVPMYGASVDGLKLGNALDAVYSRYGVTWDIKIDYSFDDDSWDTDDNGLNSGNSGFFSAYTSEMRALNSAYVAERGITDNTVYLFWFDSTAGDSEGLAGDMPLDSQFGYIFAATAGASVYNTVAHELGHGAFQLRHTFSDSYSLPKYSTGNLMDYSGGTQLVKYQWDLLHDPQTMVAKWMQDDEEGEAIIPTMDFIDFTELEIDFTSFKGDIPGTLTFMTPGNYPITLPNTFKFCFSGTTSNSDLDSSIPIGVLTGFKDESDITYVGSFKKSEDNWGFTGYKNISVSEVVYYPYTTEEINQLPAPCMLTVGIEIPNECAIYIGTIEYAGIDRSIDPTQTTEVNSDFDYTKYNIPIASTYLIGNCLLPPEVSSLTLASCAELFANQVWAKFNVYGYEGMLFKYDIDGTEYFVYGNVRENGVSYYYVYDSEIGKWRPYVPPDLQSFLNSIKFLVNPKVIKKIAIDNGHESLDLFGLVPVIGEGFDVLNGLWYYLEGERGQGLLCMSAAVPVAGWVSQGGKWIWKGARQVGETVKMADGALEFVSVADNAIENITTKINTLNLPVEKVEALAVDLENSREFVNALSNNTELIVPWEVLSNYTTLRKNPDNLVVLNKIKNKFSYNGKSGIEALGEIFTNHSSVQQFIDNLNKYDEVFSGVDELTVTGIKSSSEVRIMFNNNVIGTIGSTTEISKAQLWTRFKNINKNTPEDLIKKLKELPDGGNEFLGNFVEATDETLREFLDKPELVDAWKVLDDAGVPQDVKAEPDKLTKVNRYLDNNPSKKHILIDDLKKTSDPSKFVDRTSWKDDIVQQYGEDINQFSPQGMSKNDVMQSTYEDLINASNVPSNIKEETVADLIQSAGSPFVKLNIIVGDELYKIVPKGEIVSDFSPYWISKTELDNLKIEGNLEQKLGLPINSHSVEYDVFKITAIKNIDVYTSKIAPTVQNGYKTTGGAYQTLVLDRSAWSAATKVETFIP